MLQICFKLFSSLVSREPYQPIHCPRNSTSFVAIQIYHQQFSHIIFFTFNFPHGWNQPDQLPRYSQNSMEPFQFTKISLTVVSNFPSSRLLMQGSSKVGRTQLNNIQFYRHTVVLVILKNWLGLTDTRFGDLAAKSQTRSQKPKSISESTR